jgi:hypothetical protein
MEHQQQQQWITRKRRRRRTISTFFYNSNTFIVVIILILSRIMMSNSIAPTPLSSPSTTTTTTTTTTAVAATATDTATDADADANTVQIIREALRKEGYSEIDTLYSNRYIELIINVPGRSIKKCNEKIRNSLQWRRSYNVNALRNAFIYTSNTYQKQQQQRRGHNDKQEEEDVDDDNDDGIFIPFDQQQNQSQSSQSQNQTNNTNSNNDKKPSSSSSSFTPTSKLIEVCASGAFVIKRNTIEVLMIDDDDIDIDDDDDHDDDDKQKRGRRSKENMLVLYADTSRLNWWKTGVIAGLQYHVLVLEQAFEQIRRSNNCKNKNNVHKEEEEEEEEEDELLLSESIIICVDTTNRRCRRNIGSNIHCGRGCGRERRNSWLMNNLPPPLSVVPGMVELMQKGYPTRIHRIYVGPIHPWLRTMYNYILPTMKPRSRKKIILLKEAPNNLNLKLP